VHSAGGWKSQAYADELSASAQGLLDDSTRDYQALLDMLFAELALDLPGLFGPVGLTQLFPIPAATLRELIEALNDSALDEAWGDDTTLGGFIRSGMIQNGRHSAPRSQAEAKSSHTS
jgi:hypothetical protein